MERTCVPGFSSEESCLPDQRTPNELTPLMMTLAPSNASSASSSWKALAARGTSRAGPGCTRLSLMLSMISRSRCVPIRRTSWPLSESGKARAVAIMPEPRMLMVVMLLPNVGADRANQPRPVSPCLRGRGTAPEAIWSEQFVHALLEDTCLEGQVEDGIALADRSCPRVRGLEILPAESDLDGT